MTEYLRKEAPDAKHRGSDSARRDNFEMGSKALRELAKTGDRSMIAPLVSELSQSAADRPIPCWSRWASFSPRPSTGSTRSSAS